MNKIIMIWMIDLQMTMMNNLKQKKKTLAKRVQKMSYNQMIFRKAIKKFIKDLKFCLIRNMQNQLMGKKKLLIQKKLKIYKLKF